MNLAMVAKTEMAMAQVAEGRTMDEKEQAEDTNLDVLLAQIAVSLGAVETMRQALYKEDSGTDPLKTKEIRPDEDPPKEG
jgi:hypothetical protein